MSLIHKIFIASSVALGLTIFPSVSKASVDSTLEKTLVVNVFPNPTVNSIVITLSGNERSKKGDKEQEYEYSIGNVIGQKKKKGKVKVKTGSAVKVEVDTSEWVPGVYFLVIESKGKRIIRKIIKTG